jgi:hypothetical protein
MPRRYETVIYLEIIPHSLLILWCLTKKSAGA